MKTELLRQFRHLRIDPDCQGQVRVRSCGINRYLMRILMNHADNKVRRVFIGGLVVGEPSGSGGISHGPRTGMSGVRQSFQTPWYIVLPYSVFHRSWNSLLSATENTAPGTNGDVCSADQLEHAERVSYLFVAPLIAADNSDAEHFGLRRLD